MERFWETSVNFTVSGNTVPSLDLPVMACFHDICNNSTVTVPHSIRVTHWYVLTVECMQACALLFELT